MTEIKNRFGRLILTLRKPLPGADLSGEHLDEAILCNANLQGTDFSRTYLMAASLAGSDITDARFCLAQMDGANLIGVKAQGADFEDAHLRNAILTGGDFKGADFCSSYLAGAICSGANFEDAFMENCAIEGAKLEGIKNAYPFHKEGGRQCLAIRFEGDIMILAGCFWGTLEQFQQKAIEEYGDNEKENYKAQIAEIEAWAKTLKLSRDQRPQVASHVLPPGLPPTHRKLTRD